MVEDAAAAKRLFQRFEKVAEGVFLTRDLVSEPANVLFPKSLAAEAKKLDRLGVKVTVLGEKEMKRDRTSVVYGKRGSVRVDHGRCRIVETTHTERTGQRVTSTRS